MKHGYFLFFILFFVIALNCENYVEFDKVEGVISKNDLSIKFEILDNRQHQYEIDKVEGEKFGHNYHLEILVKNKFSLSSGEIKIQAGKKYKLSLTMKNLGANPVLLYSFWKMPKTSLRQNTFAGENGNPPNSKTKEYFDEWKTFEETFETREGEDALMIRLYAEKGSFAIGDFSIEEIQP